MLKKHKWTIIPFIIIATLIFTSLYYLTVRKHSAPAEPLKAIPVNASFIVKVNDFQALHSTISMNNALWSEFISIAEFRRMDLQLRFLDSLYLSAPEIKQVLDNPPFFISGHLMGKDRIGLMHVLHLPQRQQARKIEDLIGSLVVRFGTIKIRNYEGTDIHEVALLNEKQVGNFSFAFYQDILMVSFSTILLEDAIRQLISGESLATVPGFRRLYEMAGKNVDANVFVNFEEFPRSFSILVRPESKSEVRSMKNFAGWAELDVNLLSDMLLMNGFVSPPDSLSSMARVFLSQSPQRVTADEVLPASTAALLTISLSDSKKYIEDYRAFLRDQNLLSGYDNTLRSLNNAYSTNFPDDLLEIMDNELTLAFEPGSREDAPAQKYILMRVKSKAQAIEKMTGLLSKIAAVESNPLSSYISDYKLDAELSFKIYTLPVNKFVSKVFGNLFSPIDKHYFMVIENYLVFSETPESLKSLAHSYVLNKTLKNEPAYKDFKNSLSPRSNLLLYCNLFKGNSVFSPQLTPEINRFWMKNLDAFQKVQAAGIQLYNSNRMLYTNLLLKYIEGYNSSAQTVWESKLDTLAAFKPVFVMNHRSGQNEVFVQDLKNNIYLINQVGRVLWKIRLPEAVNSDIYQVDYFKNGKLQLLFSTKNRIYMVDRNGNFVEKYPVQLRSPATCGLSVFDYDNNKNYRLFIACEDRHIYAYTKEGTILAGWQFGETESEVTQPLNHFRVGDKDFLVFGDRLKTYILDRKGDTRVNVDTYFPRSARNNYLLNIPRDGSAPSVVTTDTTGKVYFIGFNGTVKTVAMPGGFSNNHFFEYKDLNGDGRPEFIFTDNERLTVYNSDQSARFTYKFKEPVTVKPLTYQFSASDRKLGVVAARDNLIYLFNNNGELYSGFPLQGNTPFSIGNFGDSLARFNLVVGSRDNFLYNYRVK
ncbi:MAG: DUF3352 domain-containing protein [Bacteroidales bacterium]